MADIKHNHGLMTECHCPRPGRKDALAVVIDAVQSVAWRVSRFRLVKECDDV